MPGRAPRIHALAVSVALALGGCSEPAGSRSEPTPSEPSPEPAPAGCRDYSTLDVSQLPPLEGGPHAALLDQVWRTVLDKHFDPTLGCTDWPKLREIHARKVAEAHSDAEAYAQINAMLDELGQSHTRLFAPSAAEDTVGPASPELVVRWVGDELVVVSSHADGPQGPVLPGAALLAINDVPVGPLVAEVRERYGQRALPRMIARAVAARLSCEREGQVKKLKVTNPDKDQRNAVRVVPCVTPPGERITLGNLRDVPTRVEHRMLGDGVGLLRFNVWMLPMVKQMEAALAEMRAQGMRALVLDLRGNPGGVGAMAVPVARMLLDHDGSLGTMRFRDFEQELHVEPGDDPFVGPVVVLVDESTASTSEIFVVGMRDLGRITVIGGQPSAGAALPSVIEQLPGGALLQTVVADYRSPNGTVVEGQGITPDVRVEESREAFVGGRDPVLEAAREHLAGALAALPTPPAADTDGDATAPEPPTAEGSTGAGPG
ncbi:MAG: hypothetical protein H6712_14435 [Myxococcales bacterium]|nr:hypothetical protein [Myxococcales bacterium]